MRTEFRQKATDFIVNKLKFIDESGVNLGFTRPYGRAKPGQRVIEDVPSHSGTHMTLIAAIGLTGISAPWVIEGALDGDAFEIWVKDMLVPTLQPGDILLMDNLSVHKASWVESLIKSCNAFLEYLPPYSADFNPIEKCWSKIKTALRAAKARSVDELIEAINRALLTISDADIIAWFTFCGYPLLS